MVSCSICGGELRRRYRKSFGVSFAIDGEHRWYVCIACGHLKVLPELEETVLRKFWVGETRAEHYQTKEWDTGWHRVIVDECERFCALFPEPRGGTLLDVGCGKGWFLKIAEYYGFEPYGIEIDPESAGIAREKMNLKVYTELTEGVFPDKLEWIVANYVLEHQRDGEGFLRFLLSRCAEGGTVLLSLPNAASLQCRILGRHWRSLSIPDHIQMYTPKSLEILLQRLPVQWFEVSMMPDNPLRLAKILRHYWDVLAPLRWGVRVLGLGETVHRLRSRKDYARVGLTEGARADIPTAIRRYLDSRRNPTSVERLGRLVDRVFRSLGLSGSMMVRIRK